MPKLTPKQAAFVCEYLVDLNATQAAIRAGYSAKTARAQAARLLTKVNIQEAVVEGKAVRAERVEVDQDFVIKRLKIEAEGSGPDTNSAARARATELLGKHLGMFSDKVQVENIGPAPVFQLVPAPKKEENEDE